MISIYHKVDSHFQMTNDASKLASIKKEDIIWIDMLGWNEENEKLIENHFMLEIMNTAESVGVEQSTRYIEYGNYFVSHIKFITEKNKILSAEIVAFTIEKELIITVRNYDFRSFKETAKKVLSANNTITSSEVFLNIMDLRIANDADLVEEISKEIAELSKKITSDKHTSKPLILKLNALRESLMLLMQNCIDKKLLISLIKKTTYIHQKIAAELDISVKDLESVIDFIRFNSERLDYIGVTLNNLITYEQNNSIKLFTIVSLFFMPPMLIASIYGMNFHFIPELKWKYGYPLSLGFMVFTVIATLIYFKRKRWM